MGRDIAAERADVDRVIEGKTLCSEFAATCERLGDRDALKWRTGDGSWSALSWTQYREHASAAALGLREIGLAPGEFAVIMCRNRPEHVIADLGAVHAGATPVSLYNTLAPEQVAYIAGHCDATVAIVEDLAFYEKFQKVRDELPNLRRVVLIEGAGEADPSWTMSWDELLGAGRAARERDPNAFDAMWRGVKPEDILTLIYTSGTTGPPKGVMDTHRSVLWDIESYRRVYATGPDDRVISYLPLAHAADRFLTYWQAIVAGHVTHYCPDLTQLLPTLLDVRPTFFGAVPRVWEKLHAGINAAIAAEPDEQRRAMVTGAIDAARAAVAVEEKGETVPAPIAATRTASEPVFAAMRAKIGVDEARVTITGAAPTPPEVLEFFHAIGVRISEVWGMSELATIATMNPLDRIKIGSIGVTLPGIEARIADDGELLVRGGMVMRGYYKDPEKTAETIDADGWLATGDVATMDDDGYLRIVDRKKELIITAGGKNISPANIESLLKSHALIGQACVIGDNRQYLSALIVLDGEIAPAWAAARGLGGASIAELSSHPDVADEIARAVADVNARLSRVEQLKKWTVLPAEWTAESEELTPTLKLKRRVIGTKYADVIESMY
jgi:long-chain acyl-CoA synthetase